MRSPDASGSRRMRGGRGRLCLSTETHISLLMRERLTSISGVMMARGTSATRAAHTGSTCRHRSGRNVNTTNQKDARVAAAPPNERTNGTKNQTVKQYRRLASCLCDCPMDQSGQREGGHTCTTARTLDNGLLQRTKYSSCTPTQSDVCRFVSIGLYTCDRKRERRGERGGRS